MSRDLRYRIGKLSLLELRLGDITEEMTDAIVNAANSSLLGGGGVDGAIHRAAGPQLLAECRKVRDRRGSLPPGQAVITPGGNLKAKYVIHTVGPVWNGGNMNEPEILKSCYSSAIEEASRQGCLSVSFPSISTGIFGYPVDLAAPIALGALAGLLHQPRSVTLARFVLFDRDTHRAYADAAAKLPVMFPDFQIVAEPIA
jgi:O-acetyl-ADP-ribose deacetylase (regulator of RNase III)